VRSHAPPGRADSACRVHRIPNTPRRTGATPRSRS
jgi:hypothetical protein